jgi:hypothetical protein
MNRSNLVRLVLAAALACAAKTLWAQQALEIIPLRHGTVEQVLPALQPLVEPGGTLSGSRGQLFLRASPANVAEIKRALDAIDLPSRRLQILVRLDDAGERERRAVGASGTVSSRGAHIDITAGDSRGTAGERVDQRLQVLEGGRATIFVGSSQPMRLPGGTELQDLASGFEVVPRLAGGNVILEIFQQREMQGAQPGSIQGQRVATTVTTRLGEWTEIGGTASSAARDDRGIATASRARATESRRVWVKVEELR